MRNGAAVGGVRGTVMGMSPDSCLPRPSCTKAAWSEILDVFKMLNEPLFVGLRPLSIESSGLFVPHWVRPEAVVIGSHPQQHLDLLRSDRGILALIILYFSCSASERVSVDFRGILPNNTP